MAEVVLTSIAKSALQLFTSLAKDEFVLLWHSQKELERLQLTIETISDLLQDADKMQSKQLSVLNCLSRLRNVMYGAEDFLDAMVAQVLHKKTRSGNSFTKEVRLFFSKSSNQLCFIFKTAHQVKSIRESLDHIRRDMAICGFIKQPTPVVSHQVIRVDRSRTHSFVHQEDVIGRDQDRDNIIDMLLPKVEGHRSVSVVALTGFGGLGKTTLARLVYNDQRVEQGFDVRLWACANYLSNLEQVLIEIIASKEGRHVCDQLGLEKLQEKLREIVGGRKFLVVLDDVWDENYRNWAELEPILRCGRYGSKVLVTSRSTKVAECLDALKPYIQLGVLSEESAWALFVQKAFHEGEIIKHPELVPIGKAIVSKCREIPLAIVTVGSLLRQKRKEERIWLEFLDNQLKEVLSSGDDNCIKQVLMVSYNDLHPNLKLCFASCSLFPKDHMFDKDELVSLWLGQGFIKPFEDNSKTLEEQGEEYFFDLVERSFFQDVRVHPFRWTFYDKCARNGIYRHFATVHDLLHDLAISVAKAESIFLDKDSINQVNRGRLRHISIHHDLVDCFDVGSVTPLSLSS